MAVKKKGRTVVITGASSGIGLKLKELFVKNGDTVIGLSRSKDEQYENSFRCDVTDEAQVNECFNNIALKFPVIDILINNAGVGVSGATELIDKNDAARVMTTNYDGTFFVSRAALKLMQRGGKIVNVSSACALFALPFRAVYCASKAAVNMLSFGMRMELSKTGIDVVTVCPGDIKSNFTANRIKSHETNSRYSNRVERAAHHVDSREDKRMSLDKAGKKIFKIAHKKRGALYIVGAKYKFLFFCSKIIPMGAYLRLTDMMFGGK